MLSALGGSGSKPSANLNFLDGATVPLPYPGRYEDVTRTVYSVLRFPTHGRGVKFCVGNPINDKFGTVLSAKLVGSDKHPMQAAQAPPTERMRFLRVGSYLHDEEGNSKVEAYVDERLSVHAKYMKQISSRVSAVLAATASESKSRTNRAVARVQYKGDTWSATLRAHPGPSVGVSGLASVTEKLALGGEVYFRTDTFLKRGLPGVPPFICGSATARYVSGDWESTAQYAVTGSHLMYASFLRNVGPNVALAAQLMCRPSDLRSQVSVGASMTLPHTKTVMKAAIESNGRVYSSWERRLLSTVRLRVTSQMDVFAFKLAPQPPSPNAPPIHGNMFGVMLQAGYVPPNDSEWTPCLVAWRQTKDLPEQ